MRRRFAARLEYNGAAFYGFARQQQGPTIQDSLETALTEIADHPVTLITAGRTDTGVHATGQIIHFDSQAIRSHYSWLAGCNRFLPKDIVLHWVQQVDNNFHARYSALSRHYRYIIYNHPIRPSLMRKLVTWVPYRLNVAAMQHASKLLLGEHDFSAFRASSCQAKNPVRTIHAIDIKDHHPWICLDFIANAYLHHMIRNIVGSLLDIAKEERDASWLKAVLKNKDRRKAGITAPPNGLYLTKIDYDPKWKLPVTEANPVCYWYTR